MSKDKDLQFFQSIKDVFDIVFKDYGLVLQGEPVWSGDGEYKVTAKQGDIALNFYLSVTPMSPVCYCSLGIKLSGDLAKKATPGTHKWPMNSMDVLVVAEILDPNFQKPPMEIQTIDELRKILEIEKVCLLKYCQGILSGDVSIWPTLVEQLERQSSAR